MGASIKPRKTAFGTQHPVVGPGQDYATIDGKISGVVLEQRHPRSWLLGFGVAFLALMLFLYTILYLLTRGVGIWGINVPVAWGFAIINFVWWIGIGHAGTLISAILLLMRQDWRTSINRFAEAMTLFAIACAGLMPILHLGRPWFVYYILPYPNNLGLWPQFRSPLTWDVVAITTYGLVSLIFWYLGLVPDLAVVRDRAQRRWRKVVAGFFALGWRGSARHWHRYQTTYLLLAGLATPLVISVHSIVGLDFAFEIVPGWHSTIFPPYFVAGAIFSGLAMVLTLVIPVRKIYGLEQMVTMRHIDFMAKLMLTTGLITSYGYVNEVFFAWYSGSQFEMYMMANRLTGPYAHVFWIVVACNVVIIQALWFKRLRQNLVALFVIAILVNVGMWLERYMIVVTSLHRDYLPSSWGMYQGTLWDWALFAGSLGLFAALMFLFIRFVPMISMTEMKELVFEQRAGAEKLDRMQGDAADAPTGSPYSAQETMRWDRGKEEE